MQRVTGIGGAFIRAQDPPGLAARYDRHLGGTRAPRDHDQSPRVQAGGPTVFAAFDADSDCFGRAEQARMVNFRVADLDAMVAQLHAAGIAVEFDPTDYPNGRFARLHDPEGNPIEPWEPAE